MYQVEQQVLYAGHGICKIVAIESMRFGKTRAKYYCLQPVEQKDARFYVPVDNEAAVSKLRPIATKEELLELLHSDEVRVSAWIPEENQRKLRYRELITSGDRTELLRMIHTIHGHKEQLAAAGKKLHQCDEGFLHDAQKQLNAEFSLVFGLTPGEVSGFITSEMGSSKNQD